jgi:hypothetical protein
MNRQICLAAISLAVALTGATAAFAAEKHHSATATHVSAQVTDPRKMVGNNHATWCDVSSACNGWDKWLGLVNEKKLKMAPPPQ